MAGGGSIRVLTWNLNGLDATRLDSRMEAACVELVLGVTIRQAMEGAPSPPLPDVFCLQEVVRRAHKGKLAGHLGAAGFELYPDTPPEAEEYSMIAVRPPWRIDEAGWNPFEDSPLARGWIEASLTNPAGDRVCVLTAHMESLRSGSESRVAQALELDRRLNRDATPSIFAGDTNLRQTEWRASVDAGLNVKDAFDLAGEPARSRDTWWPQTEGSERGFRFDRIWLSAEPRCTVDAFRTRRRPKISDHAALEALVSW